MPTLPISRSQTAGGSRKRSGVRASSADVPVTSPQSLRANPLSVPRDAFATTAGVGAKELAPALDQAADRLRVSETKVQNREDILERSKGTSAFRSSLNKMFTEADEQGDLSDRGALSTLGGQYGEARQAALDAFQGSADAKARYEVDLNNVYDTAINKAGVKASEIGNSNIDAEISQRSAPLVSSATADPTIENIRGLWLDSDAIVEDFSNTLDPIEGRAKAQGARERISIGAFDSVLLAGNLEQAEDMLGDPEFFASLSDGAQRDSRRRLGKAFSDRKNIALEAATAGAVRRAENDADLEKTEKVMSLFNIESPFVGGKDPESVSAPFEDGSKPSDPMTKVNRLFKVAQVFAMSGETGMANNFMQQGRVILANHPEILKSKELDKILSVKAAGTLGVPVGSTMRDALGVIPPSPAEQAGKTAKARAKAKAGVKGEEQIAFISEATGIIDNVLEESISDPHFLNLLGIGGTVRSLGQTTFGVIGDLGATEFVDFVKEMAITDSELGINDITTMFESENLSAIGVIENSIGLILARIRQPSGRLTVDLIKRSISDVGLTGLKSKKQVQDRLNFLKDLMSSRVKGIEKRFDLEAEETNDPDDTAPLSEEEEVDIESVGGLPTGMPEGSKLVGTSADGNPVWQAPDGKRFEVSAGG